MVRAAECMQPACNVAMWRRTLRRPARMKVGLYTHYFHYPALRLRSRKRSGLQARALTLTDDLEVVAVGRKSLEAMISRAPLREEDELVINGDPNEVVKTLTARRDLELAYSSESDVPGPEGKQSKYSTPGEARRIMEKKWASESPPSTSEQATTGSISGKRRLRAKRMHPNRSLPGKASRNANNASGEQLLAYLERLQTESSPGAQKNSSTSATGVWYSRMKSKLLTVEEERALGKMIKRGRAIAEAKSNFMDTHGRRPKMREVANELGVSVKKLRQECDHMQRAVTMLVEYNLRSVVPIVKTVATVSQAKGVELADLLVAGRDGLKRAAEKFDPDKAKFITYSHLWVKQSIQRCLREETRTIFLPANVFEKLNKIIRYVESQDDLGKDSAPSTSQIAEAIGIPEKTVKTYMKASKRPISFDDPVYDDGEESLQARVADTRTTEVPKDLSSDIREQLNIALSTLSPRERNIIRMRYGLCSMDDKSMSLQSIGSTYGLSTEWVRKIEDEGLQKLRKPWRRALLESPKREDILDG